MPQFLRGTSAYECIRANAGTLGLGEKTEPWNFNQAIPLVPTH